MAPSVELIRSAIALLLLWAFVFWAWRDYRVDAFRERLFALRDELFNYALAENIPFDQPAYWMLRKKMNSVIRFAHMFTFTRLTVAVLLKKSTPSLNVADEWVRAVNGLESETIEARLREFYYRMNVIIIKEMFFRSVVLALSFPILRVLYKDWWHLSDARNTPRDPGRKEREHRLVSKMRLDLLEAQALQAQSEERESEELVAV